MFKKKDTPSSAPASVAPEPTVAIRIVAPKGLTWGGRHRPPGDVVELTEHQAEGFFESGAGAYADPSRRTPGRDEAYVARRLRQGTLGKDDPSVVAGRLAALEALTAGRA